MMGLASVATWLVGALAALELAPALVFFAQTTAARRPRDVARSAAEGAPPRVVVLMPAHDEALGITVAIESALAELGPSDRLLVIADNCSDDTASVARRAGAEVVERTDPNLRGKGYALDFGVNALRADPPDVVIVLDADCTISPGTIALLARRSVATERPIQALYSMHPGLRPGLKERIASFAWLVKNEVRPRGGSRLGMPCQLMGTGMAFPWTVLATTQLASGHVVEDMQLGLLLAERGHAPLFEPAGRVESHFPTDASGQDTQRKRWEGGHLDMLRHTALPVLGRGLLRGNTQAVLLALDLSVPPLALFVLLQAGTWLVSGALFLFAGSGLAGAGAIPAATLALLLSSVGVGSLGLGVFTAWSRFGRTVISLGDLASVPLYIAGKVPLYWSLLRGSRLEWVRTKRDNEGS
ncbi:MAG TPA: glycosyltransferase family 2 protein [Polyangiaceae bacterium]|nr:glycosyltransferase family 2 protein [Polyangiaceae bacterium]